MMKTTNKRIKSFMTVLLAFISITVMLSYTAFAASVTFNVNVPSSSVGVGDTVDITVEIAANDQSISSYSYEIHYDSSLLEAVSGGTKTEDGIISYSGTGESGSSMTATFKFKTLASGTASIETSATEILTADGESIDMTPAYNSINISDSAAPASEVSTDSPLSDTETYDSTAVSKEDEVGTLTEAENIPDNTLVSMHSSGNTYYIVSKPDAVEVPSAYLPVKIKLNDTDVKAYMKGTDGNTVLLYAANSDGHQGWYYFNTQEGTFLDAADILGSTGTDSLSNFMSKNKFVIMLIAIIVLVILVVVIIILAVSLKGMITDYEAQIDRLKNDLDKKDEEKKSVKTQAAEKTSDAPEHIRLSSHNDANPIIGDKALFPDDDTHESYADSDYDNQVSPDEEDYIHTDDYYDSAFADMDDGADSADSSDSAPEQTGAKSENAPIDSAFAVTEDELDNSDMSNNMDNSNEAVHTSDTAEEKQRQIQASLDEIDAALESAKKYKN